MIAKNEGRNFDNPLIKGIILLDKPYIKGVYYN
jgi:hypothetical protein